MVMNVKHYYRPNSRWCLKLVKYILNYIPFRLNHYRIILYIILFLLSLFILSDRPKLIFQSNLHIPWLTDVQYVQPLQCLPVAGRPDWPRSLQSDDEHERQNANLTVVIVTARPEFKRLPTTLAALACHLDSRRLAEVILLVPPEDVNILQPFLSTQQAKHWPWPISIISDDILLKHIHVNSYRLQMMFKLFLAQIVKTEYYLILDSDCVALWPIHVEQLLYQTTETNHQNNNVSSYKALYQIEGKLGHEQWWSESEQLIQIKLEECVSTSPSSSPTMGVTPSILSRTIALRTLCRLQKLHGDRTFPNKMANWALWRLLYGRMWTEYTLYYLTARCTQLFDTHHFHYSTIPSSNFSPSLNLYGFSIWSFPEWTSHNRHRLIESINMGLKWRRKEIEQANGQAIIDTSIKTHSLFTVLQGRQNVNPNLYHQAFYPLYIQFLKQQNHREKLVEILNKMSTDLIKE